MALFRVWDKQERRFIPDDCVLLSPSGVVYVIVTNTFGYVNLLSENWVDQDRYTVDRALGVVDKNGTPVFERDKLDFDEKEWGSPFPPEVMPPYLNDDTVHGTLDDVSNFRQVVGHAHEDDV